MIIKDIKAKHYLSEVFYDPKVQKEFRDFDFMTMTAEKGAGKSYIVLMYYKDHIFDSPNFQLGYLRDSLVELKGRVAEMLQWYKQNYPDTSKYVWTKKENMIINSIDNKIYFKGAYLSNYKIESSVVGFNNCGLIWYEEFNSEIVKYEKLKAYILICDTWARESKVKYFATGNNQSKNNILFNTWRAQLEWDYEGLTYDVFYVDKDKKTNKVLNPPIKSVCVNFGNKVTNNENYTSSPIRSMAQLVPEIYERFFLGNYSRDESIKVINAKEEVYLNDDKFTLFYHGTYYRICTGILDGKKYLVFKSERSKDYIVPAVVYTFLLSDFGENKKFKHLNQIELGQKISPYFMKYKNDQLVLTQFFDLEIWNDLINTSVSLYLKAKDMI